MKDFVFNPIFNKDLVGTCKKDSKITYFLKVSKFLGFSKAFFVVHMDNKQEKAFEMKISFVDEKYVNLNYTHQFKQFGHYWYHFEVQTDNGNFVLKRGDNLDCVQNSQNSDYLQLVTDKIQKIDENFHKGIIYHIFVDRFNRAGTIKCRENLNLINNWSKPVEKEYDKLNERVNKNCYGGNFLGIIQKLDYLKSLNVSTIYLSPIFEANSSHKYDVGDYSKIDGMFGDISTFKKLIEKANKLNINIIIDGVFNHTGSDSVYFNKLNTYKNLGAYQSKKSKYYSWYDFYEYPNSYSCWWGIKTLPQTKEDSTFPAFISGKDGIIEKYMKMGIAGFRLDVVDEISNKFLNDINRAVKKVNSKAIVVGEVWEDASTKISYGERKKYFLGSYLDSVTNYPMKNAILDFVKYGNVENFVNISNLILEQYPKNIQNNLMNILDTHDTVRAITFLGIDDYNNIDKNEKYVLSNEEKKKGKELLKIASLIQFTIMGIPTVFYGDEVGLEGMKDPYCRATYPWGKEDKELLDWYKTLGKLRDNEVFYDGDFKILYAQEGVLCYQRSKRKNKIIVVINRGCQDFDYTLDEKFTDFLTNIDKSGNLTLKPNKYIVLIK